MLKTTILGITLATALGLGGFAGGMVLSNDLKDDHYSIVLAEKENDMNSLASSLSSLNDDIVNKDKIIASLQNDKNLLQSKYNELITQDSKNKDELEKLHTQITQLNTQIETYKGQVQSLQSQYNDVQQQYSDVKAQYEELLQQNSVDKQQIQTLNESISQLNGQISNLEEQVRNLDIQKQKDLDDLRKQLEAEKEQLREELENQNQQAQEELRQQLESEKEVEKEQARQEGYEQGKSESVPDDSIDLSELENCYQVEKYSVDDQYSFISANKGHVGLSNVYLYNKADKSLNKLFENSSISLFANFDDSVMLLLYSEEFSSFSLKRWDKRSHSVTDVASEYWSSMKEGGFIGEDYLVLDSSTDILVSSDGSVSEISLMGFEPWLSFDNGFLCVKKTSVKCMLRFYSFSENSLKTIVGSVDSGSAEIENIDLAKTGHDTLLYSGQYYFDATFYYFNSDTLKLSKLELSADGPNVVPTKSSSKLVYGNGWFKSIDTEGNVNDLFTYEIGFDVLERVFWTDDKIVIITQDSSDQHLKAVVVNNETLSVEKTVDLTGSSTSVDNGSLCDLIDLKEKGFALLLCNDQTYYFALFDRDFILKINSVVIDTPLSNPKFKHEVKENEWLITIDDQQTYSFDFESQTLKLISIKF